MMKYLIIDPSGMVGHVVAIALSEMGNQVSGYGGMALDGVEHLGENLYDSGELQSAILEGKFDAVVNCSAVVNQHAEKDKAEAVYINTYLPHLLESLTAETNTVVVHRSTDCVFSGMKGSYIVTDTPDANSFYARSKAVGELDNDKDLTIRVSLIGPEREEVGEGLLNWFLGQEGAVNGFANAIWTGVTTAEYAKIVDQLVRERAHGIIHCAPEKSISKYELLKLFNDVFPKTGRLVHRIESDHVDKSLIPEFGGHDVRVPGYPDMVKGIEIWVNRHSVMYPERYFTRR